MFAIQDLRSGRAYLPQIHFLFFPKSSFLPWLTLDKPALCVPSVPVTGGDHVTSSGQWDTNGKSLLGQAAWLHSLLFLPTSKRFLIFETRVTISTGRAKSTIETPAPTLLSTRPSRFHIFPFVKQRNPYLFKYLQVRFCVARSPVINGLTE